MKHKYNRFNILFLFACLFFSILLLGCTEQGSSGGGGGDSPSALTVSQIAGGSEYSIVLLNNGTVKCWGRNQYGQLGYEDTTTRGNGPDDMGENLPIVDLGTGRYAKQITTGALHTIVLLNNNTIKCWGWNEYGQLGYGDTITRGDGVGEMGDDLDAVDLGTGRTAVQIAAGYVHTAVILDNGTVKCWGLNNFGQLGYGDVEDRGDEAGEMGDSLPAVDLGTGRTAVQIAAGMYHTVVLLDNGTVKCWGRNNRGQLGYGDTITRGDGAGEMGDDLDAVGLGTGRTAVQIAAGLYHTVVLLDNGTVKCWGNNEFGQLGYGDIIARGDGVGEMGDDLDAVDFGTGYLANKIAAGNNFTIIITNNGYVKCWGLNDCGQLGYGDTFTWGDEIMEMGDGLPEVNLGTGCTPVKVAGGSDHVIVILGDNSVKCWGLNNFGQLGYDDNEYRGDEAGEMGDNLPVVDVF